MNRILNNLSARTLKMSDAGKGVKHFTTKKALYADLGLRKSQPTLSSQAGRKKPI